MSKIRRLNYLILAAALFAGGCGSAAGGDGPDAATQANGGEDEDSAGSDASVTDERPAFQPAGPTAAPDPMLPGPFPVGVLTVDFLDEKRIDARTGKPRFLRTEIWYPAVQSAKGGPFWTYNLHDEVDENIDLGDAYDDFMAAEPLEFASQAIRDASPYRSLGPYPVIFFSHGAFSARFQYNYYTVHLASHGYIVVAPDHQNNTIWDVIRDGFDMSSVVASTEERIGDLNFLANRMEKLNGTPDHPLQGLFDLTSIGATGHSFGGGIALTMPCRDARFKMAVALAPMITIGRGYGCDYAAYPAPVMLMGATADQTLSWKEQYCIFEELIAPRKLLYELVGGGHFTFTSICEQDLESMDFGEGPDPRTDGCSETDNVPYEIAQQTIKHYATAMFNYYLRASGASAEFLQDRNEPPFDVVNFYQGEDIPAWPEGECSQ